MWMVVEVRVCVYLGNIGGRGHEWCGWLLRQKRLDGFYTCHGLVLSLGMYLMGGMLRCGGLPLPLHVCVVQG